MWRLRSQPAISCGDGCRSAGRWTGGPSHPCLAPPLAAQDRCAMLGSPCAVSRCGVAANHLIVRDPPLQDRKACVQRRNPAGTWRFPTYARRSRSGDAPMTRKLWNCGPGMSESTDRRVAGREDAVSRLYIRVDVRRLIPGVLPCKIARCRLGPEVAVGKAWSPKQEQRPTERNANGLSKLGSDGTPSVTDRTGNGQLQLAAFWTFKWEALRLRSAPPGGRQGAPVSLRSTDPV